MFIYLHKEFHFQCIQFNYKKYLLIYKRIINLINLILNLYLKLYLIIKYPKDRKNLLIENIKLAMNHHNSDFLQTRIYFCNKLKKNN